MICYRIMVGVGVFQVVMAALIGLQKAYSAAILVLPLIPTTISYSYYYARRYEPLTKFIALRSIRRSSNSDPDGVDGDLGNHRPLGHFRRWSTTIDESREKGAKFINPNLVTPCVNLSLLTLFEVAYSLQVRKPLDTPAAPTRAKWHFYTF